MAQKEGQSSRDPVLVAASWARIYVPNLSHAETRSLKPSRAKADAIRGVKQPLTLSRTIQPLGQVSRMGKGGTQKEWPNFRIFWEELKPYECTATKVKMNPCWLSGRCKTPDNPPHPTKPHLSSNLPKKVVFLPRHCRRHLSSNPLKIVVSPSSVSGS